MFVLHPSIMVTCLIKFQAMAAGLIIHLGLHVTALDGLTEPMALPVSDDLGPKIRTFWAFFLVDR